MPAETPERRPPIRRGPLGRPLSSIWFASLGLFALFLVLSLLTNSLKDGSALQYSEFKTKLEQNALSDVVITADAIRGKYTAGDGSQVAFTTVRLEDPKLVEELQAKGVHYTGEVQSHWVDMLGWVLPVLLIVGLWSFFFRRMGGAEGGIMSFARSKAKIFSDDDVKVNFGDVAGVDEAANELKEIVDFLKNPRSLHDARRAHSQRGAAGRAARHGQDAAGARGGRRSERPLLQPERVGICRDVRRGRRGARA